MKYLSVVLVLGVLLNTAFAQKKYEDPNQRQKRGLMEEGDAPTKSVVSSAIEEKIAATESSMTPQQTLCECGKLQKLNEQLTNLWWGSDEVSKAMTSKKELDGRRDNINETMIYIVKTNRDGKDAVDPDKCLDTEVAEKNIKKLKKMISLQEAKCDVYKIRGIDHD